MFDILSSSLFRWVGIPVILVLAGAAFKAAATRDIEASFGHWLVGVDLCLEGIAVNLSFMSFGTVQDRTADRFGLTLVAHLGLLAIIVYLARFGHFRNLPWLRVVVLNVLGALAIYVAFYIWSA